MAVFHTKTFLKHDDYMTPSYAWENINKFIPKDKVIWEAFYGDGKSGDDLRRLGCKEVIHEPIDFFDNDLGDMIISNPPFSRSKDVINRLKLLDKPFILIMPCSKITTSYFRDNFKDSDNPIQIIIPPKRIHFQKQINGKVPDNWENKCNFDCFYYCYKMNLERDIVWLD
tara:strand:- start:2341 stop:2850 length:510 start_codon:yes stop_codon:yes gene_type:complete